MAVSSDEVVKTFARSIDASERHDKPYRHWNLRHCLPAAAIDDMLALPFPAPELDGISGKRELHNNTRRYFDVENRGKFAVAEAVSAAFQDKRTTSKIERDFGTKLAGTHLRIELAQDVDGFWLEPHTDLGVKLFTLLIYTSKDKEHHDLGTDIYDAEKTHVGRSPFASNSALVFIPSSITYHGFEPRPIKGVRKSVIINYVSSEWRAREQLAFPEHPIAA